MTDTPVDWTKPLVAVHPDGRRVDVQFERRLSDGDYLVDCENMPSDCPHGYRPNGEYANGAQRSEWRIENRPPAYPEGMTPELAERMVALVRQVAGDTFGHRAVEARAIMAELEPVDALAGAVQETGEELGTASWSEFAERLRAELAKRGLAITEATP